MPKLTLWEYIMTLEELQAKVSDLEAEKDAVNAKNKELLGEVKKLKAQGKEVDVEKYFATVDELETTKSELEKLQKTYKLETEKLSKTLNDKDSSLQKYLIEDGLSSTLAKIGVRPEFIDASKALLRQKASIKDENGELKAFLGDKSLSDAITEWAQGDGKHFVSPPSSFGGGAGGGQGGGQKFDGTIPLDGSKSDRLNAIKQKFLKE